MEYILGYTGELFVAILLISFGAVRVRRLVWFPVWKYRVFFQMGGRFFFQIRGKIDGLFVLCKGVTLNFLFKFWSRFDGGSLELDGCMCIVEKIHSPAF